MDDHRTDVWAGVLLMALFLVMLLGELAVLRLTGN
jgi:hypothetical protein